MPQFNPANFEGRDRLAHIEDYLVTSSKSDWMNRTHILNTGLGIVAETYPMVLSDGAAVLGATGASNTLSLASVGLRAGDVITNMSMFNGSAGTAVTLHKYGLYTSSGSLMSSTSNIGTLSGLTTASLAPSVTIPSDGLYYAGFLSCAGTTVPSWVRAALTAGHGDPIGSGARRVALVATQGDIAGSVTPAANATYLPWIALT